MKSRTSLRAQLRPYALCIFLALLSLGAAIGIAFGSVGIFKEAKHNLAIRDEAQAVVAKSDAGSREDALILLRRELGQEKLAKLPRFELIPKQGNQPASLLFSEERR